MNMKNILSRLALFAVLGTSLASASPELELGTWTGFMTPPNLDPSPATYDVEKHEGVLSINLHQPGGVIPLSDIDFDGSSISFSMAGPGMVLVCELDRTESGAYAGECMNTATPDAPKGKLTMVPPAGTDKLTAAERQSQDEKTRFAVQTPPISSGDHSTRGLALLSLQLELP